MALLFLDGKDRSEGVLLSLRRNVSDLDAVLARSMNVASSSIKMMYKELYPHRKRILGDEALFESKFVVS
jgi:hypothetical protein